MTKYETAGGIQQIHMMAGKKAFIAGVNMPGRMGSLQVISYPNAENSTETPVHS